MTTSDAWLVPSVVAAFLPLRPLRRAQSSSTIQCNCARVQSASELLPVIACTNATPCKEAFFVAAQGKKGVGGVLELSLSYGLDKTVM